MEQDPRPYAICKNDHYFLQKFEIYHFFVEYTIAELNELKLSEFTMLRDLDNGKYMLGQEKKNPIQKEKTRLPYGIYYTDYDKICHEYGFFPLNIYFDQYLDLHNEIIQKLDKNILNFINSKDKYEKLKIIHKRGYLLYGPPGNGKTTLINHIIQKYSSKAYIIYINKPENIIQIRDYKELFKDNLVIFIIEELVTLNNTMDAGVLLNFLDGPYSWEHCIFLATTNYPESLPDNIIDRPSRFDQIILIDNPDEKMRRIYLRSILGKDNEQIIRETRDHSLAYLKEMCISTLLDKTSPSDNFTDVNHFREYVNKRKGKNIEYFN